MDRLALLGGEPVRRTPFADWPFYGEDEERSLIGTLRSQKLCCAAGGQTVHRFEKAFAEWCGAPGAVGEAFLPKVDGHNETRRRNAGVVRRGVADLPGIRPAPLHAPEDAREVYYNFILDFDADAAGVDRETFLKAVQAEGVPLQRNGYMPLHTLALFEEMRERAYRLPENEPILKGRRLYGRGVCPVAEAAMAGGNIELKVHPPRGPQDMEDVVTAIRKVLTQAGDLRAWREKMAPA